MKHNLLILLFALLCSASLGIPEARASVHELPSPPLSAWMLTDPKLGVHVSLDASAMPLGYALASLTRRAGVHLQTERVLGDYRISLHVKDQPLRQIMGRLVDLFGHGTLPNQSYLWNKTTDGTGQPVYFLQRKHRALEEEEALLDVPRRTCLRWLKELRTYMRLPKNQQATFRADCPCLQACIRTGMGPLDGEMRPLGEAFDTLTDSQIEELVQSGSVDLPNVAFSAEAQAALQTYPNVPAGPATGAALRLEQEEGPDASGVFYLSVNPKNRTYCSVSFVFDTQRQFTGLLDASEMQLPLQEKQGPVIDLLAHWRGPQPTAPLSMPFETVLRSIAQESGMAVYAEVFPRWPITIEQTSGTPEQLLNYACAKAGYLWRKVGPDIVVYSRSWAQDRRANIPQPLLDRWQADFARNGRHILSDLLEMAVLRDEQIKNLMHWFEVQSPMAYPGRNCLRLLATLAPADLALAYDPQGATLGALDDASLAIARKEFKADFVLPIRIYIQGDPDVPLKDPQAGFNVRKSVTITLRDQSGAAKQYSIIEPFQRPHVFK